MRVGLKPRVKKGEVVENRRFSKKKVTEAEAQVSYSAECSKRSAATWGSNRPGSANRIGNRRWAWQRLVCSKVGHDRRARGRSALIYHIGTGDVKGWQN